MRTFIRPALVGALLAAAQVQADEAEVNIGNKAVNAQLTFLNATREADFSLGYIYRKGSIHIGNIDLHARGQTALGNLPTTVGIGAQTAFFDEDKKDGSALALGGYAHVKIPEVPGLGFRAAVHFAPSITTFGDAEQYLRTDLKMTYRVIPNADVHLGFRSVRADIQDRGNESLDDSWNLGFTVQF